MCCGKIIHDLKPEMSCLAALFLGDETHAQQLCPRKVTAHATPSGFRIPGSTRWILSLPNPTRIEMRCLHHLQPIDEVLASQPVQGQLAINVPSHCEARGKGFLLPVHFQKTSFVDWSHFKYQDIKTQQAHLFSKNHLSYLTPVSVDGRPAGNGSESQLVEQTQRTATVQRILSYYGHRATDFDDIRASIQAAENRVFQDNHAFRGHVRKQETWLTVLIVLSIMGTVVGMAWVWTKCRQSTAVARLVQFQRRQRVARAEPEQGIELLGQEEPIVRERDM